MSNDTTARELVAKLYGPINVGLFEAVRNGDGQFQQLRLLPPDQALLPLFTTTWRRRKNVYYELVLPIRPAAARAMLGLAGDGNIDSGQITADMTWLSNAIRDDTSSVLSLTAMHGKASEAERATSGVLTNTEPPVDRACIDLDDGVEPMPLYELDADQDYLSQSAMQLVGPLQFAALVNFWEREIPPGTTLTAKVHALIREVIRLGGKADALALKNTTVAHLRRQLDAADEQQEIQLDLALLTNTAVCGEYDVEFQEMYEELRKESRRPLRRYREGMEEVLCSLRSEADLPRQLRMMEDLEIDLLRPTFHKIALLVEVAAEVDAASALSMCTEEALALGDSPLDSAQSQVTPASTANTVPSTISLSPTVMRLSDKLRAWSEIVTGRAIRKGLMVENAGAAGGLSACIMMYLDTRAYSGYRWMTSPPLTQQALLAYVVLAVLCPAERLRDLLLEADRMNAGAVFAHYWQKEREHKEHRAWLKEKQDAAIARGDLPGVNYTHKDPLEGDYVCP
jgi:hypothetical protein